MNTLSFVSGICLIAFAGVLLALWLAFWFCWCRYQHSRVYAKCSALMKDTKASCKDDRLPAPGKEQKTKQEK